MQLCELEPLASLELEQGGSAHNFRQEFSFPQYKARDARSALAPRGCVLSKCMPTGLPTAFFQKMCKSSSRNTENDADFFCIIFRGLRASARALVQSYASLNIQLLLMLKVKTVGHIIARLPKRQIDIT